MGREGQESLSEVHAVGTRGRVGVLLQVHLKRNLISCHFVVFFVVKESETTKHFLNFFRKKYTKGTVPFVYGSAIIRLLGRLTVFRWSHLESLAE